VQGADDHDSAAGGLHLLRLLHERTAAAAHQHHLWAASEDIELGEDRVESIISAVIVQIVTSAVQSTRHNSHNPKHAKRKVFSPNRGAYTQHKGRGNVCDDVMMRALPCP